MNIILMDLNIPLLTLEKAKGLQAMITLRGRATTGIIKARSMYIHLHLKMQISFLKISTMKI